MKALSRSPAMFTVCMLGVRPRLYAEQRYAEYRDAERRAKEDARLTLCAHDVYLGLRLVATVSAPNFAGKVAVDMTDFGSRYA
ncbi:MAG: hypothetical protein ABF968_16010 [Acetobacter sp.]|uniref:hypothetical protein n=1 Tax=Acetobacter sp. TaxID=440 RepID=UPI0039EB7297